MQQSNKFWNASIEQLKQGYVEEKDTFACLLCEKQIEKGQIYVDKDKYYEAERYMQMHIEHAHESVFHSLMQMNKKLTGLTEHQNKLLRLFYDGKNDTEIKQEMGVGSNSTIRNHRFSLKEKERQAKIFLVMMELLHEKDQHAPQFVEVHKTATMLDDRYNITKKEQEDVLKKYLVDGQLKRFPRKEKFKLIILSEIIQKFKVDKSYIEKEVNEILKTFYVDYVTLRRYLIEYGFLDRKDDGSQYWVKT
ncbi:DUF2087 domain-containing protein [Longirhabdus pacifica]|uniref:DUF2087 domain-containing protein n=1 Tax=Longirhabdus pacifica TaxID=2305227 RepID=UPI001008D829|nr:DUF2087 domain-containing protein [Longirhabdus pacifica]